MIRNETTATLRICGAVLGFSLLAAVATPARAVPAFFGAARVVPLVYAVNQGGFTATAYRESARGNVPPALAIAGTRTQIFEPNGLAVSPTGKVAISQSDGTADPQNILEYAPGASGNAAPIATIRCAGFGGPPEQVAFDAHGNLYAEYAQLPRQGSGAIEIFAPSEQSGCVKDKHVIFGTRTGVSPAGDGITVAGGMIYDASSDAVREFRTTDSGNVAPRIIIQGPNTGLQDARGLSVDSAGYLYVANLTNVLIFSPSAHGDVTPVAVIAGSRTQFVDATSVAVSRDGRIFVANSSGCCGSTDNILVFAKGAHGNASPLQVISGPNTGLHGIAEIALLE